MKRTLEIMLLVIFISSIVLVFSKQYNGDKFSLKGTNLQWKLRYKGIKGAKDFTFDSGENCYIAFNNRVQLVDENGKSKVLFEDDKLDICSITYRNNKLYYITDRRLISYDLETKSFQEIIADLPNFGDYRESNLLIRDNILYITIGSATNSGVVGEDNLWLKEKPFQHDISPKMLTINGRNGSKQKTGAFVPFNTKNVTGQVIPAHLPGNASIMAYNTENSTSWLYAWGIRNVTGIDHNSEGRIFMTIGGMEDRGARPVKGDVDYIYELKENIWYGWPDYSGGDPLNSPRFKGANGERVQFVLDKHPTTNPPAPVYQHKALSVLNHLVIDREGVIGEKDSIYFLDSKDNILYEMNKSGVVREKARLGSSSISAVKFHNGVAFILDSSNGYIVTMSRKADSGLTLNRSIGYYLLVLIMLLIVSILWKVKN